MIRFLLPLVTLFIMNSTAFADASAKRFVPAAKKAVEGVVTIFAEPKMNDALGSLFNDPVFKHFFENARPMKKQLRPVGSGVIISEDGIVISCYHVVRNGKNIHVKLKDDSEYLAEIVAKDERNDLVALRLKKKGKESKDEEKRKFPYLELADSDKYELAHEVLALGNPFGVRSLVSHGIISNPAVQIGKKRLIVTDAPINPGNSGGALVDADDGKLIGIPNAILSKTGASQGIGFAIPANMVRAVLESIKKGLATVVRPWLGLSVQKMEPAMAESLNIQDSQGVIIKNIHPLSPLVKEKIHQGDVVLALNDKPIKNEEDLDYILQGLNIGSDVAIRIRHLDGKDSNEATLNTKLIAPPQNPPTKLTLIKGTNLLDGVVVSNISPYLATELGVDSTLEGVAIVEVDPTCFAAQIGLQAGDVLQAFGDQKVHDVQELVAHLKSLRKFVLFVKRDNQEIKIQLK